MNRFDPRRMLSHPFVYESFQFLLGAGRGRRTLVAEHIRPKERDRVLDIGCGPGALLAEFPRVDYVGFDESARYVEAARKRFGDRGAFRHARVEEETLSEEDPFDLVLAVGVVHHLSDAQAAALFSLAARVLRSGGRLVTADPCLVEEQSRLARYFISRDRGEHVRGPEGYEKLVRTAFSELRTRVRGDLLRIPYTHFVIEAVKT